jgi:hypothetical protein
MLGRKDYTQDELDRAKGAVRQQLAAYRKLAKALDGAADPKAAAALEALEPVLFTNMVLVLDRHFVHRLRMVTGKDGNALNEVELLSDALLANGGELRGNNVIKYVPDESVLKLEVGERVSLGASGFERLSTAFFAEIESRFVR